MMRPAPIVSTMADVLNNVVALFGAVGDLRSDTHLAKDGGVAVLIGKRYLPMSSNDAPPRIVLVQDEEGGGWGGVPAMSSGYCGSMREAATCYVWGDVNAPAWRPATEYRSGVNVANGGNVYRSVKTGASGNGGGPAGAGQGIPDGSMAWDFLSVEVPYDATRSDLATQLMVRLVNVIARAAAGNISRTKVEKSADPNQETYGENYRLGFTYSWGVPRDRAVWSVPVVAISPPDRMRPEGRTPLVPILDVITDGSR